MGPKVIRVICAGFSLPQTAWAGLAAWRKAVAFEVVELPLTAGLVRRDELLDSLDEHDGFDLAIVCTSSANDFLRSDHRVRRGSHDYVFVSSYYWDAPQMEHDVRWYLTVLGLGLSVLYDLGCQAAGCAFDERELSSVTRPPSLHLCGQCAKRLRGVDPQLETEVLEGLRWAWEQLFPMRRMFAPERASLPLTDLVSRKLALSHPGCLNGTAMILVLHLLPDLVPLLDAFERLGLKPAETVLIGKPYPYAGKSDTVVRLLSRGYKVTLASEHKARFSEESIPPRVVIEALRAVCDGAYIIVEDGGYCAGALLANAGIKRPLGVVEQTAKGARRTETAQNLDFPVVSVAKSQFKADWEAPLIGRTVAENIRALLPEVHTDGGTAMVLGFGSIGQNVCRYLSGYLGMLVRVVDPNPTRVELALSAEFAGVVESAGTELGSLADGVMLVVGTAGSTTVDAAMLDALADETYLVSASSDRNEIAVDVLEDLAGPHGTTVLARGVVEYRISNGSGPKRIRILGDGYPVNFFGASSVPNESIDPIMLLLLLGAVQVATENLGPEVRTDIPDDFVKEYRLRENFRMLHGGGDSGEKDV